MSELPKVYSINYNLRNAEGAIVDTSSGGEPLTFLEGSGQVVKGIEKALEGRPPGSVLDVTVPPELAYGEHNPDHLQEVPKSLFDGVEDVVPGMKFQTNTGEQTQVIKVVKVQGDKVTVDANHPLAGFTLYFDIELLAVREATEEEVRLGYPISNP
ncbi:FKBP-type peptidyl-prolyl cis-trans isomerase [Alkalimarinus sediminis]|uniref:Peptidyl-prolyl cis-trans isomerase n=1 Tax=Alkalimarinus sediminis TaxID=1632866 RepID=A0A9E8HHN5_9ALTE|nr:peptidylprolyl isomerase [Alkalimarinus sediminis]UZW73542.1 peptidylprolyl isomerase [Alkalimarinus sediminis]